MTQFGSRVVASQSVSALVVLGRSGEDATIHCQGARAHAPLWLMPSSDAPPFTSTGIAILGFVLLVASALAHPATADLTFRRKGAQSQNRS